MSKLFGNLNTEGAEKVVDRVGGGGTVPTGIHTGTIKAAYAGKSDGGANSITILADLGGRELRVTEWVTNKAGQNTWQDKQDKTKKHLLPGFITVNDLCLLLADAELSDMDFEEKVLKLYDYDAKKEIPTNVQVIAGLTGKPVTLAVVEQIVDKTKKNEATGEYEPTGETRNENIIEKVLHSDMRTVTEIREGVTEAGWAPKWLEKNAGKTRNKAKGADGKTGAPGGRGAPAAGGTSQAPKSSLFGAK
jgi:hypothetical protein